MTLPEFSPDFCPECGSELVSRIIEGRERLYCEECNRVEWLNPNICAGVILEKDGKILMQKRGINPHKGKWSIPAGYLELEESPVEAARRELEEETGLRLTSKPEFLGHIDLEHPDESKVVVAVFQANFEDTEGKMDREEKEVQELEFWSKEKIFSEKEKLDYTDYLDLIRKIKE